MSVKTMAGTIGALAAVAVAGMVASNLNTPGGWPLNSQARGDGAGQLAGVRRGSSVRLLVSWTRPYTPASVTTMANDGTQDYDQKALPALVGFWYRDYPYQPGTTYSITVQQTNRSATKTHCEIVVAGKSMDKNTRDGVAGLHCVVQG